MTSDPTTGVSRRRRPKGDKRERTRAKLLDATRELIREKGYERTTLQDVARRAGMTSGAIYGNFKNRDDLFMALAVIHGAPIKPEFRPDSSFAEKMRTLAEAVVAAIPERRVGAVHALRFKTYALTNEEIRAQLHNVTARDYGAGAAWLRTVTDEGELPMPPDIFVRVVHAMIEGLLLQRFLTPELVPDEVFYAAFAALVVERRKE